MMTNETQNLTPQEIEQARELLSPYIDGEVTEVERSLVERTLARSTELQLELATLRQTVRLLNQLPRVSTPRPFTLREAGVGLAPSAVVKTRAPSFWRRLNLMPLLGGLATLVAVVVCGALILARGAGLPGANAPAPEAASVAETVVEEAAAPTAEMAEQEIAEPAEAPAALQAEPGSDGDAQKVVVEQEAEVITEAEVAAEEAESAAAAEDAAAGLAVEERSMTGTAPPMPSPAPTTTAVPLSLAVPAEEGAMPQLTVEALELQIKPGQIQITGRLPLPEDTPLRITFWRNDDAFDWADPKTLEADVGAEGEIDIVIRARKDQADFDLFGVEPASYLLKLESQDPVHPGVALVPFDTYGPQPDN